MVDLKPSTMRPYFALLSRARREARARKAIHGETVRYTFTHEVSRSASKRVAEFVSAFDAPKKKATSNRQRGRKTTHLAPSINEQLAQIQGDKCYLCDHPWFTFIPDLEPTFDHVIPKYHGGKRRRNGLIAHSICNKAKGNRWPLPCELIYLEAVNAIREAKFGPL